MKTGKPIEPMAASQNPRRYTDKNEVEKMVSSKLQGGFRPGMHSPGKGRLHYLHDQTMTAPVLVALLALALMFAGGAAWGDELERVPPITSATAKKECGACHMAYQPQFLPADAWRRMFGELDRHFGADASLAESMRQEILDYYVAHAGKARAGEAVTSRITETPQWIQAHRKVKAADWTKPEVKFKGNCLACHKRADDGVYEED